MNNFGVSFKGKNTIVIFTLVHLLSSSSISLSKIKNENVQKLIQIDLNGIHKYIEKLMKLFHLEEEGQLSSNLSISGVDSSEADFEGMNKVRTRLFRCISTWKPWFAMFLMIWRNNLREIPWSAPTLTFFYRYRTNSCIQFSWYCDAPFNLYFICANVGCVGV